MDKIKKLRMTENNSFIDVPIGANASDVDMANGSNVQESINQLNTNKLDKSDVTSYVHSEVTDWLNDNVTPAGSAVVVDQSLSIQGAAADAKKTGDQITELKEDLNSIETDIEDIYLGKPIEVSGVNKLNPADIKQNTYINSTGNESPYTGLDATGYINVVSDKSSIAFTGLNYAGTSRVYLPVNSILFYNSEKTVVSHMDGVPSNTIMPIPSNAIYTRLVVESSYISQRQPMVELVNAKEDISSTFVQYEEVTERSKGLNELIEDVDALSAIPETVSDLSDSVDALASQVAQNTEDIDALLGTKKTIDHLTTFARGGAGSSGAYETFYQWRVATPDIYTLTEDIVLTIADGFRVYLNYFSNGTRISGGWISSGTSILSGSEIRLMIARVTEDTSEVADVETFCSKVLYGAEGGLEALSEQVEILNEQVEMLDMLNSKTYGMTWDWWISANSVDKFGNIYIGYIDSESYGGVLKRQPDGTMQYKQLERSYNDDDHNGMATIVLDDGRVLVIGSYGHTVGNHIICWRSIEPYSIENMEQLSFDITGNNYKYKTCYSQVFKYNGKLFDFMRFGSSLTSESSYTFGFACLISTDNGSTWTPYKVFNGVDAYQALAQATDDDKYLKVIVAANPAGGNHIFKGCYIDLSNYKIYDLIGTEIGQMAAINGGSIEGETCPNELDMTSLIAQTVTGSKGRLFFTGRSQLASTVFLYATSDSSADDNYTYKVYNNGNVVEVGKSGVPFANTSYISGACFGKDLNTIYYSKSTDSNPDGNHELHKVKIDNNAIEDDSIITEASMCILRPLFLGNGEVATVVGHYNDDGSFTSWDLKPLFTHA